MKRSVRTFFLAAAGVLAVTVTPVGANAQRIGFVNVEQIMAGAPGLAEARTTFQGEVQAIQPELERMAAELDSLQQQYQRQQATLAAAARTQRETELQTKYNALQQRQLTLQTREQELLAPITRRIEEVIEQIRREGSFSIIFSSTESGIIAADETLDLTNRVLDRLRTGPATAAPTTPAAP